MARQRILVIQPLVGIGDLIWHKPWLDWLASRHDLWLLAKPTSQPNVILNKTVPPDQILPLERSLRGSRGRHDGASGFYQLVCDIRHIQPDRAIILHHSWRYAAAAALAGIKHRSGYGFGLQRRFLTEGTGLPPEYRRAHPTQKMQKFAALNSWDMPAPSWTLYPERWAMQRARDWLDTPALAAGQPPPRHLIIGIGAMADERRWPIERFAELLNLLARARPDLKLIVTGGPGDRQRGQQLACQIPKDQRPVFLFDRLDMAIACQALCDGYVGNDTSLLNIAAALGKPALGFFSQSPPMSWSDKFHHTAQISRSEFGQPGVIAKITPTAVLDRINDIWPVQGPLAQS